MSNVSVDRVREDLAVMRQALGRPCPYGPKQVRDSLVLAAIGAAIAAITAFTGIALPAEPGSARNLLYGGLIAGPMLLLFAWGSMKAYRQRSAEPLGWRQMRIALLAFVLAMPVFFASLYWMSRRGQSVATFIIAGVIFCGMLWLIGALCDPRYRHSWGWGVSTLLFGVAMPLGNYQTAGILAGCWLLLGNLSTAAIMAWHLRREHAHAND